MSGFTTQKLHDVYLNLFSNIQSIIKGNKLTIRHMLAAFFAEGHLLLDDVPGTGKTTMAKAVARSIGVDFKRVQFTPDLLPSDITGVSVYNKKESSFQFRKGPVFTTILLADEINRANPKTQSALLEAMSERQVTVDGTLYPFDSLFFVIATENPVESTGTYALPESQLDRFAMRLTPGYVDYATECAVVTEHMNGKRLSSLESVVTQEEVKEVIKAIKKVRVSEHIISYIVSLVTATRGAEGVVIGASPRASIFMMEIARALAFFDEREFVIPKDIKEIASAVIAHRLVLQPSARYGGLTAATVVDKILDSVTVPS
ncbi:MoxR family ATPase [bacterium]|nr:MoxR family ATPase [bacterium]